MPAGIIPDAQQPVAIAAVFAENSVLNSQRKDGMSFMKGINKITERITQNAEQEIAAIIRESQSKADDITARYTEAARKESIEILSRGQAAAEERMERLAGVAMLDSRKLELSVKQEMLNLVFDTAFERLNRLGEEEYIALLAKLAAKASHNGKEEILLSKEDRVRAGEKIVQIANGLIPGGGSLTLAADTRTIKGGLILRDGDIETNCTFESLIRLLKSEKSTELAGILFD